VRLTAHAGFGGRLHVAREFSQTEGSLTGTDRFNAWLLRNVVGFIACWQLIGIWRRRGYHELPGDGQPDHGMWDCARRYGS